jgi:hypothetical protein
MKSTIYWCRAEARGLLPDGECPAGRGCTYIDQTDEDCRCADAVEARLMLKDHDAKVTLHPTDEEVVVIETTLSPLRLRKILEKGRDLHVMTESLSLPERYDGDRRYGYPHCRGHRKDEGQQMLTKAEADELYVELEEAFKNVGKIRKRLLDCMYNDETEILFSGTEGENSPEKRARMAAEQAGIYDTFFDEA